MATVTINRRGEDRVLSGHPWVYRSDVVEVHADAGGIVTVHGTRGRVLGDALFSDRSEITVRMLTRGDVRADERLLRARLEQAIAFRESLKIDATAYRLVHEIGRASCRGNGKTVMRGVGVKIRERARNN